MTFNKSASAEEQNVQEPLIVKMGNEYLLSTVVGVHELGQKKSAGFALSQEDENAFDLMDARLQTFGKLAGRAFEGAAELMFKRESLTEQELNKAASTIVSRPEVFGALMEKVANVVQVVEHRAFEAYNNSQGQCPVVDLNDAQTFMRAKSAAVELSTRAYLDGDYASNETYERLASTFGKAASKVVNQANAEGFTMPEDLNKAASVNMLDKITDSILLPALMN